MQPDWMKGRVSSEDYEKASKLLSTQKAALAKYAEDVNAAAKIFRDKQQLLEKTKEKELSTSMEHPLVFIMNLNINYLPIDSQVRYVRAGYLDDPAAAQKERDELDAELRELQELALSQYIDGSFNRKSFQPRM